MKLRDGERVSSTINGFPMGAPVKQQPGSYQIHMSKLDKIYNLRPILTTTTKIAPKILEASNLRKQGLRQAEKRRCICDTQADKQRYSEKTLTW